ncbi:MAG TPA: hypothetical protein VFT46_09885 [Holophagaceae bacterium]|nr:hypothetical protein [Holophagaceae bacterium]
MTELDQTPHDHADAEEGPVTIRQVLKENWVLARALIFFILMLAVPLFVAWKFNLFLVANN